MSTIRDVTDFTHEIPGAWKLQFSFLKEYVFSKTGTKSNCINISDNIMTDWDCLNMVLNPFL